MDWRLRCRERDWSFLRTHLLRGAAADEEAAFVLCGISLSRARGVLLAREIVPVPDAAMLAKGRGGITIAPDFIAPLVKRCRQEQFALLQAHSHPFSTERTHFSGIDDAGELSLFPRIQRRAPGSTLGALVFGQNSFDGRVWPVGATASVPLSAAVVIGNTEDEMLPTCATSVQHTADGIYDRQVLFIGNDAQARISKISVGIVGLGGTGSHVAQQLAYLGVRNFLLADPDTVEESNLSRLIGATPKDIGQPKVKVIERAIRSLGPSQVQTLQGDVYHKSVAMAFRDIDVLVCCTDTLTSRMVLTRIAAQYLLPLIDLGINIQLEPSGALARIGGRIMVQLPDDPCLDCMGVLQPEILSRELMSPAERHANPYVEGAIDEHAPAVVSLNGVVASLAVTEFLQLVSGRLARNNPRTFQMYDGIKGTTRVVSFTPENNCGVCDEVRGMGDLVPLPCLQDR
jgi:molybdopterin-synthase adenylyltransferase